MRLFISQCLKRIRNKYNVIHIHFFSKNFLHLKVSNIQKSTESLIITLWGSDFYKRNKVQLNKMRPYLDFASKIIFSNPDMKEDFSRFFFEYKSKCEVLSTGLGVLSTIDCLSNLYSQKYIYKKELGIDPSKTIVTIGYGSQTDQRQVEIIENISTHFDGKKLANIHFIFPLTYGDPIYKQKIIATAQKHNFTFTALTTPLSKEQIAKYRVASDIMIHLRDTDQFSGSFQEYLYANNLVITGKWLPYQFILDKGIYLHTLSKLDDLSDTLEFILVNLDNEFKKTSGNKRIIAEISHWNVLVDKHIAIYNKGE